MSVLRRAKRTRARRRPRQMDWWVTKENRRKIAREAKSLGMTSNEYLRLMSSLSSTLRENLQLNANLQPKELLRLVENPLFAVLLQWLSKNALSSVVEDAEESPAPLQAAPFLPDAPRARQPQGIARPMVTSPPVPSPPARDRQLYGQSQTPHPWPYL